MCNSAMDVPHKTPMFSNKIAFVVATKDRPKELRHMLGSLDRQTHRPDQIIIIDAGTQPLEEVLRSFPELNLTYSTMFPPSATKQRNFGLTKIDPEITHVGFLDDDVELDVKAIEKLMLFWEDAPHQVAGVAMNMVNHPDLVASSLKYLPLTQWLGLYSQIKGDVLPSGFQTMIGKVKKNSYVKWLPTGAVVWKKKIFEDYQFDEWFREYSYLEDVDFSYRVGKKFRLMVIGDAKYYHFPAGEGRGSDYRFGMREVDNRLYLVKKYRELSLLKCYLALLVRMMMNLGLFLRQQKFNYFQRALGNASGLMSSLFKL
ncbi:glycosyltransferase family 2 protein [Acidobacteriota bacterium]